MKKYLCAILILYLQDYHDVLVNLNKKYYYHRLIGTKNSMKKLKDNADEKRKVPKQPLYSHL